MITDKELVEQAINAKSKSISTYSSFHVGAALLTEDEKIILGANIENASYGLTICAERTAVFQALLDGKRQGDWSDSGLPDGSRAGHQRTRATSLRGPGITGCVRGDRDGN